MINFLDALAIKINFHNVKATGAVAKIFVLQEYTCRLDYFFLLAKVDRLDRQAVTNTRPRFDFDENSIMSISADLIRKFLAMIL